MKKILLLLFIVNFIKSYSQIDSLNEVYNSGNDSLKMEAAFQLAENYLRQRHSEDTFLIYSQSALEISEKINSKWHKAKAIKFIGDYYKRNDDLDSALNLLNNSLKIFTSIIDSSMMGQNYISLSGVYERKGDLVTSTDMNIKAAEIFEKIGDNKHLGIAYSNVSLLFSKQEDFISCLKYRRKAYVLSKELNPYYHSYLATKLGGIFGELYLQNVNSTYGDSLMKYVEIGLQVAQKNNLPSLELRALSMLTAYNYTIESNYELALIYANTLITKSKEIQNDRQLCEGYFKKSDILIEMENYSLADKYADSALITAEKMDWDYYKMVSYERIYDANKKGGNYDIALAAYEKFKTFEDSLVNVEKTEAINNLEKKYQTEKKEKEIVELQREAELQNLKNQKQNTIISLVISLLIIIIILSYFFYKQRILKEQNEVINVKQRLLRAQINPHFFFNALASIQTFFLKEQDGKKAVLYLSKFSKLMRLVLENSSEDYISLDEEVTTLENYLELQKVRFNESFTYQIHLDESIDKFDTEIPPMFAQPFIENSLEHGLLPKDGDGRIDIYFTKKGNSIEFVVEDNGVGLEKSSEIRRSKAKDHKSRATQITKDRLYILNKERGTNIELLIDDIYNSAKEVIGTKVSIDLPYKLN